MKFSIKNITVVLIYLLFSATLYSQRLYVKKEYNPLISKEIKLIDISRKIERIQKQNQTDSEGKQLKSLIVGESIQVELNSKTNGTWIENYDGTVSWHIAIYSENAKSLSVYFSEFYIPNGGELYVYNDDGRFVRGPFTKMNENKTGGLPLLPVPGEIIRIEFRVPRNLKGKEFLQISEVGHHYIDILKDGRFGRSGSCNPDINCTEGENWQIEKFGIVRLLIGTSTYCTGILVNNTAENGMPYVLTANHCINDSIDAAKVIVVFDYESPYCDGPDGNTDRNYSQEKAIAVAELVATKKDLDFALIKLYEEPPFEYYPYYLGWDATGDELDSLTCIHHPQGDVKKISFDKDSISTTSYGGGFMDNAHWLVQEWDYGTTEGGSSGSPIFTNNKRIKGTLTGGYANCFNPIKDYYAKFSLAWDYFSDSTEQLKYWLDPMNTGNLVFDGFDPFDDYKKTCDTLINIYDWRERFNMEFASPNSGYWTGTNSYSASAYAEKFARIINGKISGIKINVANVNLTSEKDSVLFQVLDGGYLPGKEIYRKQLPLKIFSDSTINTIKFDSLVHVSNDFYISYVFKFEDYESSQFSVFHSLAGNGEENTAFVKMNGQWEEFNNTETETQAISLDLETMICELEKVSLPTNLNDKIFQPNPVVNNGFIYFDDLGNSTVRVRVTDISGKVMIDRMEESKDGLVEVSMNNLQTGIYILTCSFGDKQYSRRIIKM